MEEWKRAERFPGDTLLLRNVDGGEGFECDDRGWFSRPGGERVEAASVLKRTDPEHRDFVWASTARLIVKSAQSLADAAAGVLYGRAPLAKVRECRLQLELIEDELAALGRIR